MWTNVLDTKETDEIPVYHVKIAEMSNNEFWQMQRVFKTPNIFIQMFGIIIICGHTDTCNHFAKSRKI